MPDQQPPILSHPYLVNPLTLNRDLTHGYPAPFLREYEAAMCGNSGQDCPHSALSTQNLRESQLFQNRQMPEYGTSPQLSNSHQAVSPGAICNEGSGSREPEPAAEGRKPETLYFQDFARNLLSPKIFPEIFP
jgi:hypothetical protein